MGCHAFVAVKDFERARRDAQLHHFAHQGMGRRAMCPSNSTW